MKPTLMLFQIILGVLLILVILIQKKGSGIGVTFGGDLSFYRTKRGAEKLLFWMTIIFATLLILLSIVGLAI